MPLNLIGPSFNMLVISGLAVQCHKKTKAMPPRPENNINVLFLLVTGKAKTNYAKSVHL